MPLVRKPKPKAPRTLLCDFLAKLTSQPTPVTEPLQECLGEALEGLHALEYGEATPIFTPRKTKAKGATPYSAKKYRMIALGFVDLLRKKGYRAGKARAKVGIAFGAGRSTIKEWRKELDKIDDSWMQHFRKTIADSTDWDDHRVSAELAEAAKKYVSANKKKKQDKQEKKQKQQQQRDDSPSRG